MKLQLFIGIFLFLFLPRVAFAVVAESQISGRVVDSQGNAIVNSEIVLTDENGNVSKAFTDSEGQYKASVPNGTYSISVKGPQGSDMPSSETNGQIISGQTTRDFTLSTNPQYNSAKYASQQVINNKIITYVLFGILIVVAIVSFYIYWRSLKKKKSIKEVDSESS